MNKAPKKPTALEVLLDKEAESRYHNKSAAYQERAMRLPYKPVDNGPWGTTNEN